MKYQDKVDYLNEHSQDDMVILMDGYEKALVGYENCNLPLRAIYDYDKCIKILQTRDSMSLQEAEEYFEFNTAKSLDYIELKYRPILLKKF